MKTSLRFVGITFFIALIFTGCSKDTPLTPTSDPLELRNSEKEDGACLRCPEIVTCSLNTWMKAEA